MRPTMRLEVMGMSDPTARNKVIEILDINV